MRILTLLLSCCVAIQAYGNDKPLISAQPGWLYQVKPDLTRKTDLKKISGGYFLELVDQQVNIPAQTRFMHYTRRIVNEAGIQDASEVSVEFLPEYQTLIFHYVKVIRNGIEINHLKAGDIKVIQEENDVEDYQYNGEKRAFIILKDIRKDDRIDVAYSIKGFNPVLAGKFATSIYFADDNPVNNYFQTVIADTDKQLKFTYYQSCPKPEETVEGKSKIYHWSNPPVSIWESMPGAPTWFDPYPSVAISEMQTWQQVSDWALSINDNYNYELPASIKLKIEDWRKRSNGNEDDFIVQALRFVQDEIRYLGLEIGINTHRPHPPKEVLNNGYGDCKDKALLLTMILRSQNISSYAALVSTETRGDLINRAPSPYEFNHVIVAIEKAGNLKFVDPTESYQRGTLSEAGTGPFQYALLIKPGESALRSIPAVPSTVVSLEELKIKFYDTSRLTVKTTYTGAKADATRNSLATTSNNDLKERYTKYYASTFEGIRMSNDVEWKDDSAKNMLSIDESYVIPSAWTEDDAKKLHLYTYASIIDEVFTDPADKSDKYPLSIRYPQKIRHTIVLEMPEPWNLENENMHIKSDSYEFTLDATTNGSLITLKYSVTTFKDHIPVAEIAQYRKDYKKITEALQFHFSYGGESGGGSTTQPTAIPYLVAFFSLLGIGVVVAAFYYFNKRTVTVAYDPADAYKLGGWTLFLGFTLLATLAREIYSVYDGGYFSASSYAVWDKFGNGFNSLVLAEVFVAFLSISGTVAIIYWFMQRRDIFPIMFTSYITLLLITQAIMYMVYKDFENRPGLENIASGGLKGLFQTLIYGVVWSTYLARSTRVKATFLKSYNS